MALAFVVALAALTRMLAPVVATIIVVQILIAAAPSPADARGRAIPTPQLVATLAGGLVAAAIACQPPVLIGAAGTRAGIDGLAITGVLAGLMPGVAVGVLVAIGAQLTRKDDRRELVVSLSTVVSLVLFAGIATAWIGAARTASGRQIVTIAGAAILAALAVWLVFGPRTLPSVVSVAFGSAAAAGMALRLNGAATWEFAAIVGAAVSGFAVVGLLVGMAWTQGRHHVSAGWGFPGALAFALTGPLVYVAGQMVSAAL
jgi:hypothetical protein